jgi:hypothetical protein
MPYSIRKRKCKRSDGGSGSYTMTYTDKKGKYHSNCHRSKKSARAQIGAIEMKESILRELIREQMLGLFDGIFEENFEDGSDNVAIGQATR